MGPYAFYTVGGGVYRQHFQHTPASQQLTEALLADDTPQVTIHASIVEKGPKSSEGFLVSSVSTAWFRIYEEIKKNPEFLFQFVEDGHKFEEFIAGVYEQSGWSVTLTPRSGDAGRDVIAEKKGFGSLRFVEQCKAYRRDRRVTAEEVRAMYGVWSADLQSNKAIVTTTADFAPRISEDPLLKPILGNRLELRNGQALVEMLSRMK